MAHKEKIFKLDNGNRLKVEITFHFDSFRYDYDKSKENMSYYAFVTYLEKGKKKGIRVNNEDWLPQIQKIALELWQDFKPKFTSLTHRQAFYFFSKSTFRRIKTNTTPENLLRNIVNLGFPFILSENTLKNTTNIEYQIKTKNVKRTTQKWTVSMI